MLRVSGVLSWIGFGIGRFNTQAEIDYVAARVVETVKRLRDNLAKSREGFRKCTHRLTPSPLPPRTLATPARALPPRAV